MISKDSQLKWKLIRSWKNNNLFYGILERNNKFYFLKKIIHNEEELRNTLKNEVKMYKKLNDCSFVPKIIYYNLEKNYIIYEYIDGVNILKTREKKLIKDYLLKLTNALSILHSRYIAHCDIKPANILIFENRLYILDYGISQYFGERTSYATTKYSSPEQQRKEKVSEWFDIYSVGILISELFKSIDLSEKLSSQKYLIEEYKFSKNIEKIIEKATTLKKQVRYKNILEMKKDIEKI